MVLLLFQGFKDKTRTRKKEKIFKRTAMARGESAKKKMPRRRRESPDQRTANAAHGGRGRGGHSSDGSPTVGHTDGSNSEGGRPQQRAQDQSDTQIPSDFSSSANDLAGQEEAVVEYMRIPTAEEFMRMPRNERLVQSMTLLASSPPPEGWVPVTHQYHRT